VPQVAWVQLPSFSVLSGTCLQGAEAASA